MPKRQQDYSKPVKDLHELGVLRKGEDIDAVESCGYGGFGNDLIKPVPVYAFLTNQRLIIMVEKSIMFSWDLDEILSVSKIIGGLFEKRVTNADISIKSGEKVITGWLCIDYGETFFDKIIQNKKKYSKIKSVKVDTLVVEEGKDEEALAILKKRLARGEITLEEFHQIVQRL